MEKICKGGDKMRKGDVEERRKERRCSREVVLEEDWMRWRREGRKGRREEKRR